MHAHKILGALFACAVATGCIGTTDPYVATDAPPPPREEVVVTQPGMIWIHGHWLRDNGAWHWHPGYYERERVGQRYVEGHWTYHGNRRIYVEGAWRSS